MIQQEQADRASARVDVVHRRESSFVAEAMEARDHLLPTGAIGELCDHRQYNNYNFEPLSKVPFSFLNPWFWLGALAVAAPLWLHLRRKKQTNLVQFSALRFLDDQPEPRRSPLRLRNFVLLALRVLALVCVVAAFAWPYLRRADTVPIKESRVYVLDNTLSHQARDGFARDRDRILTELGKAGSAIQVAVIELTSTPRVVVSFGDDRPIARQKLQALQPSFQRGSYLAAFRQAGSLLSNSLGQQKRIVLLGDNQQNQWNENISTPPFLGNISIDLPKTAAPMLPNLSVSEPRVQRIFLGDKSLVNFTAKLSHSGEAKNANLILRANGQVIFNRSVDLDQQPQTILLQAQWEVEPAAWLRGEVTVEGAPDALAADNHAYFSLAPVVEGKVALLAQSPYLRLALSPEIMRGEWATRLIEPASLSAELAADQDAEVLCLESNYLQSGDARKLLWRYLTNGRGAVLLVNRVTPSIKGLFFQGTKFPGKLFVAAFGLDREHVSWPVHPSFIPFLDLTLQAARADDPTPTAFEPGEVTVIQLPATAAAREVVLKEENRDFSRTPVEKGRAQVRMPDRPGLYTLTYDESSNVEKIMSVNPSAKESELAYVDSPEAVKTWRVNAPGAKKSLVSASQTALSLRGILQQQLWWWMVIGGLLALLLEMVMAVGQGRKEHE